MTPAPRRPVAADALLAVGCLLALGALGALVATSAALQHFDDGVRTWMLGHQQPPLPALLRAVTTLGSAPLVLPLLLVFTGLSSWTRGVAEPLMAALIGSGLLVVTVGVLKAVLGRSSPNGGAATFLTGAWPSGHTATATVVYGLTGLLLRESTARRPGGSARWAWWGVLGLPVLVATGLVYCDFHWFSDVIGGFLLGVPIIVAAQTLTRRLLRPVDPVLPPARDTASQNRA